MSEVLEGGAGAASTRGEPLTAVLVGDARQELVTRLTKTAQSLRRHVVQMVAEAGSGHPGGSLSATEILAVLYFAVLRHDPQRPQWPDRDRFIMSKGHASPIMYATLAESGYFSKDLLPTFRKFGSPLQGHNDSTAVPGVEMSAGSLGMGLSFGIGHALAGRLDGRDYRVYVLLGDGECQEGQVWEAAMTATFHRLDNLIAIVDRNNIQNDDFVHVTTELEPLADKWRAFGWHVDEVDGHDLSALWDVSQRVRAIKGRPSVIIAHTVKGKGVSFMENNPDFHGRAPSQEQLVQALREIG